MDIVRISEIMNVNLRIAGHAYSRSINAKAEHWMRIGMLMELYPILTYTEICKMIVKSSTENNGNDDLILFNFKFHSQQKDTRNESR